MIPATLIEVPKMGESVHMVTSVLVHRPEQNLRIYLA